MLMANEYLWDLKEQLQDVPDCIFANRGLTKTSVLADANTMEQLWVLYQKSVEEYESDPRYAARDALCDVLGIPFDNPFVFEMYGLHIRTSSGSIWREYGSLQELKESLARHFTKSEQEEALAKLTTFTASMVKPADGYAKKSWRNFEVCAYPA